MQVNTVSTHTHTPSTSCLCQHLRQTTLLGRLCPTLCPRWQTPALLFNPKQDVRQATRYVAPAERSFVKMLLFSLTCLLCCGEAKVPAVLSPSLCHASASPSFSPLAHTTRSVPPWTDCPFSLTPATCHWKESITLSAHSERAVKRPVRAIKALRVKSSSTQQNLKRTLL